MSRSPSKSEGQAILKWGQRNRDFLRCNWLIDIRAQRELEAI